MVPRKLSRLVPPLLLVCLCGNIIGNVQAVDEQLVLTLRGLQQVRWTQQRQMLHAVQHPNTAANTAGGLCVQDSTNTTNASYAHDITWNSLFHHQPMHQHHSGYKFMLTKQQRQRGISHYGSAERLRAALSRAVTSK